MQSKVVRISYLMLSLLASVLIFSAVTFAQQTASGAVSGQVTDPTGAVVPNATVTLQQAGKTAVTTKSDKSGNYVVRGLAPGKYNVSVLAKGFAAFSTQGLQVNAGQTQTLDAGLQIAVEQQNVSVEAQGNALDISPDNNASATVLKGKDLDALSDDPDEFEQELQALAGPSAGPNGGQIYIDGFTGGQLPPKSAIREIRINQNPFSAEYDKPGYGRIEVFTKPGSDKYHGQIMFNDNESFFNAKSRFAPSNLPDYNSRMESGNFGGPLGKKASFFLDVQHRAIDEYEVVNTQYVDPAANFAKIDTFEQVVANPRSRWNVSPRIDLQLTSTNTLSLRYQYFNNAETNDGVGNQSLASQAYNNSSSEQNVQLSDTQTYGSKIVNENRFRFERESALENALDLAPAITVQGEFTDGGNPIVRNSNLQDNYEYQNYTSVASGDHFIRFGGRLRDTAQTLGTQQNFNGSYIFNSLPAYQITQQGLAAGMSAAAIRAAGGGASQFDVTVGTPSVNNNYVDVGLYAEDDWKLRPNFTLSYGLRYETQNAIHDHNDWAPRLGIAWGLGKKGSSPKTIIRAGYGIFYDRFAEANIINAERLNGTTQQEYIVTHPDFFPAIPTVAQLGALGGITTAPTIYQIDRHLRAPYTMQAAVGVERSLGKIGKITETYINSRGVHQFLTDNVNAPLPGTYDPTNPASGVRPNPAEGNIYDYLSEGIFKQNQLITNVSLNLNARMSLAGWYTFGYANSDTSGVGGFPTQPYDIPADYGRAAFDVRNRLFLMGSFSLPYGVRFSPFMVAQSGTPYNFTTGRDLNGDSIFNDRPYFTNSPADGINVKATPYGNMTLNPALENGLVPINLGTSPATFTFNMRLSKTIGFGPESGGKSGGGGGDGGHDHGPRGGFGGYGGGPHGGMFGGGSTNRRYNLTISAMARNLFNEVNLSAPVSTLTSQEFLQYRTLGGAFGGNSQVANRRIDLNVQFSF